MYKAEVNNHRPWSIRLFALLTLSVYLFALVQNSIVHQWHHHDHAHELHSEEQEQDSCHQAIYHQGESCGHETHVQSISQTCELCDIILSSQEKQEPGQLLNPKPAALFFLNAQYTYKVKTSFPVNHPLRGPPVIA